MFFEAVLILPYVLELQ